MKFKHINIKILAFPAVVVGVLLWLLWPILGSPYVADDIPNSQRSAHLDFYSENWLQFVFRITRQWMKNEGRIFPVAVFENVLLFHSVHSRFLYKALQLVFVVVLIMMLAYLVHLLTHCGKTAMLSVVFFAVALQVRVWYDPTISFGLLLPSVGIKSIAAFILILLGMRSETKLNQRAFFAAGAVCWSLALMQYEVVILLAPIAVLIALHENEGTKLRRIAGVCTIGLPSFAYAILSHLVRSGAHPSPAYSTNFDPSAFLPTLKYQVLGAVPLTVPYSRVDNRFGIGGTITHLSTPQVIFCSVVVFGIAYLIFSTGDLPRKTRATLFLTGAIFLVHPAIPTSLSVRWQEEVGPGHAYLPVMLQYLGTSMLLLVATIEINNLIKKLIQNNKVLFRGISIGFATILSIVSVATICVNRSGIEYANATYRGFRVDREIFEATVRRGLIKESMGGGVFLYSAFDPALWVNKEYVMWLGGPTVADFGQPASMIGCRELGEAKCLADNGGIYIVEHNREGTPTATFTILRNWWEMPTSSMDIESTWAIARDPNELLCGNSLAKEINGWWVSTCGVGDSETLERIQAQFAL